MRHISNKISHPVTTDSLQQVYSQFGAILLEVGFEDESSETLASERYCNLTLSALSNVFTTYLLKRFVLKIISGRYFLRISRNEISLTMHKRKQTTKCTCSY